MHFSLLYNSVRVAGALYVSMLQRIHCKDVAIISRVILSKGRCHSTLACGRASGTGLAREAAAPRDLSASCFVASWTRHGLGLRVRDCEVGTKRGECLGFHVMSAILALVGR